MIKENTMDEELHYSDDRDDRVKETAEVFTPNSLVEKMLSDLDIDWTNPPQERTFLDPTCGSGNFLIALARRGIPLENIYGVDLMQDNIETTRKRLTEYFSENGMTADDINFHLGRNIVEADALTYHYGFWWYKTEKEKEDEFFGEF